MKIRLDQSLWFVCVDVCRDADRVVVGDTLD